MERKMYIVVRHDLKLPKGKMAVQAAHAAVGLTMKAKDTAAFKEWYNEGQGKVVVYCDNEKRLFSLMQKAKDLKLNTYLVRDAGRTVVPEGTITCFGIGPDDEEKIAAVTGELKLV